MKSRPAFTLVEIMITLSIMAVLVASGVGTSIQASRRKLVDAEANKLEGVILTARDNALAGKKIACAGSLAGWGVDIVSATSYNLVEYCGCLVPVNNPSCTATGTISATYGTPANISIIAGVVDPLIFRPLGLGAFSASNPNGFTSKPAVTGFGWQKEVEVSNVGSIEKNTLVVYNTPIPTSTPVPTSTPIPTPTPTRTPTPTSPPVPTPTPRPIVALNAATGQSCDQICQSSGRVCLSVGTNSGGTNGSYYSGKPGFACSIKPSNCAMQMGATNSACSFVPSNWTRCSCK